MEKICIPRGTADILPEVMSLWQKIEISSRVLLKNFNYREIRTPLFEQTDLFARSMGQTSDVVQKQMLNLASQNTDEQGRIQLSGLSLRPEGTASIVRSYIENRIDKKEVLSKLFYIGPMFRGERPQKGRLRQFHQIGAEAIGPGSASPYLDAEMISVAMELLNALGLKGIRLRINTLGSADDKTRFSEFLRQSLNSRRSELCPDCQNRFDRNIFRVLDCKNPVCKEVVSDLQLDRSYLSQDSRAYYEQVKESLAMLQIPFEEDLNLVRGLDYYTHTVFEINGSSLGSQDALGAGGRYNDLVAQLGGPSVDAVGFALGVERMILAMGEPAAEEGMLDYFFVVADETALNETIRLMRILRAQNVSCDMDYRRGSVKSQMRQADKNRARRVVILGGEEIQNRQVTVKILTDGRQVIMDRNDFEQANKREDLLRV